MSRGGARDAGTGERPRARADLVFRQLAGDEWVVFDPEGRRLHVTNLPGALVWVHCTGEHTVDEIVAVVRDAFRDPPGPERVAEDVRRTLELFREKGLLA